MSLPKNILIVEDEMIAQRYLRDILSQYGASEVTCFTNAEDTMLWLREHSCDMILTDINIKGAKDGIQMAKDILHKYDVPIMFITAYSDNETLDSALLLSPYGYIVKPFTQSNAILQIKVSYQKFLHNKPKMNIEKTLELNKENKVKLGNGYEFSFNKSTLLKEDKQIYLSHKQNALIEELCRNINHVVSFDQLEYALWGEEPHAKSALRTLVYSLRNSVPGIKITSQSKVGYSIKSE